MSHSDELWIINSFSFTCNTVIPLHNLHGKLTFYQSSSESAMPCLAPHLLAFHKAAHWQSMNFVLGCWNSSWGLDVQKPKDTRTAADRVPWKSIVNSFKEVERSADDVLQGILRTAGFLNQSNILGLQFYLFSLIFSDYLRCIGVAPTCEGRISLHYR